MKMIITLFSLFLLLVSCTDMDNSFLTEEQEVLRFSISELDTIDPYSESLVSGTVSLGDTDGKGVNWTNIEPELTLTVSHGHVVQTPYVSADGGTNSFTAQSAAQKLQFEWKITKPVTENTVTIAASMDLTTGGKITSSKVIHLSHLSPTFVDVLLSKDSLSAAERDTVIATVTLNNVNGPVGKIISVEIKQASDNSHTVSILRNDAFAIDGSYEFRIVNPSTNDGSVRVWVEAEGVVADSRVVHFK